MLSRTLQVSPPGARQGGVGPPGCAGVLRTDGESRQKQVGAQGQNLGDGAGGIPTSRTLPHDHHQGPVGWKAVGEEISSRNSGGER